MVKEFIKKRMEEHPYWKLFEWHPINLALKKDETQT